MAAMYAQHANPNAAVASLKTYANLKKKQSHQVKKKRLLQLVHFSPISVDNFVYIFLVDCYKPRIYWLVSKLLDFQPTQINT